MKQSYSYRGDYIQGKFVKVTDSNGEIGNQNPGNLEAEAPSFPFRYEHVNEAVTAAERGFTSWRRMLLSDRLAALARYREVLAKEEGKLGALITLETGKPLWEAHQEVRETLTYLDDSLAEANRPPPDPNVRLLPRGVAAVFGATDMPALGSHRYLLPALIHGNTVIFKSSKYAPTVGQFLAHVSHEAGIPAGVFNVIHGGFEIGRRLASHAGVDIVFFVGSYEKAQKIQKGLLNDYGKTLVLDTGGKNGLVVWEDAHYETALQHAFFSAFVTSGQRSSNAHRLLVHESLFDRFVTDLHAMAKKCKIGYGMAEGEDAPFMGPLLSEKSVESYLAIQGIAQREGGEEIMRGKPIERKERGYYVSPSLHVVHEPKPKSVYEQSEIFGPNAALYKVKDLEEVIEWLNYSEYGLVASLYTKSKAILNRCLDDLKVGQVHWNLPTTSISDKVPLAGLKKSGNSRPMGSFAPWQCTYPLALVDDAAGLTLPPTLPKVKS